MYPHWGTLKCGARRSQDLHFQGFLYFFPLNEFEGKSEMAKSAGVIMSLLKHLQYIIIIYIYICTSPIPMFAACSHIFLMEFSEEKSAYGCTWVPPTLSWPNSADFWAQKKISWLKIGLPAAKLNICWPIDAHSNHKKVHPKNSEIFNP